MWQIGRFLFYTFVRVQLKTNCEKENIEVYGEEKTKDSPLIVKNGLKHFQNSNLDIVLIDTAGRHKQEKDLLDEMTEINNNKELQASFKRALDDAKNRKGSMVK